MKYLEVVILFKHNTLVPIIFIENTHVNLVHLILLVITVPLPKTLRYLFYKEMDSFQSKSELTKHIYTPYVCIIYMT